MSENQPPLPSLEWTTSNSLKTPDDQALTSAEELDKNNNECQRKIHGNQILL